MTKKIEAIYQHGVFHPVEPVDLKEHQRVTIIVDDHNPQLSDRAGKNQMPTNGAELIAYWEQAGLIGSRPDIPDSVEHARKLRRLAETRQP